MDLMNEPGHPSDEELAAFLADRLDPVGRASVESHLARCPECRDVITAGSGALADHRARRVTLAGGALVAAAALVALLVASPDLTPVRDPGPVERVPTVGSEAVGWFAAHHPPDEAGLTQDRVEFSWASQPDGAIYQLTVSDDRGRVVWSARGPDSSAVLPRGVRESLVPGQIYYWRVEALLADLSTARTVVRSFTIEHQ